MAQSKTDKIVKYVRQKSIDKENMVLAAIQTMLETKQKITFYSVCKATGVSKSFLYSNEKICKRIREIRDGDASPVDQETSDTIIDALKMENKTLQKRIKELEHEGNWRVKYEKAKEAADFYKEKCEQLLGNKY